MIPVISNPAQDGFDRLLVQAIKSSLAMQAEDICDVAALAGLPEVANTKIVMLTVSSYLFRAIVLINFAPDRRTKEYFARAANSKTLDMSDQSFYDAVAEFGNMCCGILNRELAQFFPHIGMSTPNLIDTNCSAYLDRLGCAHIRHFKVDLNDTCLFRVSLCVCAYANLDFSIKEHEEATSTGDLELF